MFILKEAPKKSKKITLERNELQALLKVAEDGLASFDKNIHPAMGFTNVTAGTWTALFNITDKLEKLLKN
jgi:hypothetical protein